jgi:hypothetical protein
MFQRDRGEDERRLRVGARKARRRPAGAYLRPVVERRREERQLVARNGHEPG